MWPEPWFQELLDSGEVRLERDGFGLMSTWWNPGDGYPAKCSRCSTRIPAGTPRRQRYYNPNAAEYLGMYLTVSNGVLSRMPTVSGSVARKA